MKTKYTGENRKANISPEKQVKRSSIINSLFECGIISSKKFGQTDLIKRSNQCFWTLFCMQNPKPNNLKFFVGPNSKCKIIG